jgi:FtsZ-binding cell division protein ZapB
MSDKKIRQLKAELHDRTLRHRESIEATNRRINEHHKAYENTVTLLRAEIEELKAEIERLKEGGQ